MPVEDRLEIRRIAGARQANPTGPAFEKTGGVSKGDRPVGGWFAKALEGLPRRS
jgi:hypothetical protein